MFAAAGAGLAEAEAIAAWNWLVGLDWTGGNWKRTGAAEAAAGAALAAPFAAAPRGVY